MSAESSNITLGIKPAALPFIHLKLKKPEIVESDFLGIFAAAEEQPGISEPLALIRKPTPSNYAIFASRARIDKNNPLIRQWLKTVKANIARIDPRLDPLERALRGLLNSFGQYGMRYQMANNGSRGELKYSTLLIKNLIVPEEMLKIDMRSGDCRAFTLLAAATLAHFGFKMALITTPPHVIPAVVVNNNKAPIALKSGGKDIFLFPFEATPVETGFNYEAAVQKGIAFTKGSIYSATIVSLSGETIYDILNETRVFWGSPLPNRYIFLR